jgi:glycosyltransferase involved in cell wall biosynthesis
VKGPALLLVGKLTAAKGQHVAIEALADLRDYELMLVGEGPDEPGLRRLAADTGVAERVRFLGTVDHSQLPACYSAADITLLPSEREGMPNAVLESLACGTPVIATRVGGVPEVMTDAVTGMLLDERSARALAVAVRRLHAAPGERGRIREYAQRFDWSTATAAQLAVFSQVAN